MDYTRKTGRLGNPSVFLPAEELFRRMKDETGDFSRYMEDVAEQTYWIYRGKDMYGTYSYGRRNTCFWVFSERRFSSLGEAKAYLDYTGLAPLTDRIRGSVVIVTPVTDEWSQKDADAVMILQRMAIDCLLDWFGSFGRNYLIGEGKGADFIYDFVCSTPEIAMRTAGALAVGGERHPDRAKFNNSSFGLSVPAFPAYLIGVKQDALSAYLGLSGMDNALCDEKQGAVAYTSVSQEAVQVVSDCSEMTLPEAVQIVYERFLRMRMRIPISPGRNHFLDAEYFAPYWMLSPEEYGLTEVCHEDGETLDGTAIRRWYEYLPEEALSGKTDGKIPVILLLHGHCDDPRSLVEQCGFLKLAGKERIAVIAPDHQEIPDTSAEDLHQDTTKVRQIGRFLEHVLTTYPCLDPERVYVTGFSRGGLNTCLQAFFETGRYAAAAPLSGLGMFGVGTAGTAPTYEDWLISGCKMALPAYIMICGRDSVFADRFGLRAHLKLISDYTGGTAGGASDALKIFCDMNGLPVLNAEEYDFDRYPFWGFRMEELPCVQTEDLLFRKGELRNGTGDPVLRFSVAEGLEHALYYGYAEEMWDFCRHFRRNVETGEVSYSV